MAISCGVTILKRMKHENLPSKIRFLVTGAGPAGLILGILLRRRGESVAIIEREKSAFRPVCGEYLSPQGVFCLRELELDSCLEGFRPILGMLLSSPGGRRVRAPFPERMQGIALNRQEFQIRLLQKYLELGGELFLGETLRVVRPSGAEILVETNHRSFLASALVGADGRQSTVARLVGLERTKSSSTRVAVHAYLKPSMALSPYGQMHLLANGCYAGINPLGPTEANFSIVADAEVLKKAGGARGLLNHYIKTEPCLREQFSSLEDEEIKTTFPIDCHRPQIHDANIALIGDASGFIDPLTGEGITTAIKTAMLIDRKLAEATDIPSAFAAYALARRTEFRQKEMLNRVLQVVIRRPLLSESIGVCLQASPKLRRCFIGVIGNVYTPVRGFLKFLVPSFIGGKKNGQDRFRAIRVSPLPTFPAGGDSIAASDLARSPISARAIGENLRRR